MAKCGNRKEFDASRLLICEGREEESLVRHMIDSNLIQDMDTLSVGGEDGLAVQNGGIDGLCSTLKNIVGLSSFKKVTSIGIFVDADDSPKDAFDKVKRAIVKANKDKTVDGRYSVPSKAFKRSQNKYLPVLVVLSPRQGVAGCLDTLLLEVLAQEQAGVVACVEQMANCAGVGVAGHNWTLSRIDKAKVRAVLAMIVSREPAIPLTRLWERYPDVVPVDHQILAHLVEYFRIV